MDGSIGSSSSKKKPAFAAFWERRKENSSSSLPSSPPPQPSSPSSVQRLIKQYSSTASDSSRSSSSSPTGRSARRVPSRQQLVPSSAQQETAQHQPAQPIYTDASTSQTSASVAEPADSSSRGRPDKFYDAHADLSAARSERSPPPASPEDTRPWLEFSPLLPESETMPTHTPAAALRDGSLLASTAASSSRSSSGGPTNPSPSRSTSATTPSNDSPVSPTGLGLSQVLASSSNSSSISQGSSSSAALRSHRLSKLPPALPSPNAPLPSPPSESDTDLPRSSFSQSRPQSAFSSRPLSQSSAVDATMLPQRHGQEPETSSSHLFDGRTSSLQPLPSIQQRKASLLQPEEDEAELPSPMPSSASTLLSPDSVAHRGGGNGETTPRSSRPPPGRPRGFTVGAVPSSPSLSIQRNSAQLTTSSKVRPRSLLSNEIFPGLDLAQSRPTWETRPRLSAQTRSAPDTASLTGLLHDSNNAQSEAAQHDVSERRPSTRSRSGSSASLLQQVNSQPKSHASFVIAVVGHTQAGKSTVIRKGLRKFGLSEPQVLADKVASHSTVCIVDSEQRTIEVLEIDASVLLYGPSKRFAWPKFLPHIDAVILCYDAADITSFRGMSELLENFAMADLSTVMLACKSELLPKAVDPYYASDMACVWSVGLAECTTQSDEGKKRMRDCFSYLVREVAKSRSGRSRRNAANTPAVPPLPTAMTSQRSLSPATRQSAIPLRTSSGHSKESSQRSQTNSLRSTGDSPVKDADTSQDDVESPRSSLALIRERDLSDTSLNHDHGASSSGQSNDGSMIRSPVDVTSPTAFDSTSPLQQQQQQQKRRGQDAYNTSRKMSSATMTSVLSDAPSFQSDEEVILREKLIKAQLDLNTAKSAGGYVSIDELWDKLFHAAVSRTDERFVTTFMYFYRGFATPQELLTQMIARFDSLTHEEVADGLMHRFALIRLANMLADWVHDYPGDLCHPDTHAMLVDFHRRLLQHRDTTHTAGHMRGAVEAAAYAADLDAVWSRSVDKGRPQADSDETSGLPSNGNAAAVAPLSNSISDLVAREDATSAVGSDDQRPTLDGSRSRSASDVTTSSTEDVFGSLSKADGLRSHGQNHQSFGSVGRSSKLSHASHAANASSSSGAPSITHFETMSSSDQKLHLRMISNMLIDTDDDEIASELTRLEWVYFTAVQPRDLLRHILVPHEQRDGPVAKSISHFNYISNWVCSMILMQSKTKHRARMLEKFYNIAAILRHDNNYGSLNSVLGGLSKTAVHRLKHTRELLKGRPVNKAYQSLVRLMSNERSSAAYRLALENSEGPTIPYVGVHLQDILSISDGNPSKRASDGMIHWRKFSLMDEAVMAVARCQQYDRFIRPSPNVERLIVDVPILDDDLMYERSLEVEPRSQAGPVTATSKIKDLKTFLSNTGSSSSAYS